MKQSLQLALVLLLGGLLYPKAEPVCAQGASATNDSLRVAVSEGVEAIRKDDRARAMELLEGALLDTLSYISPEHGSGAYWLGQAYLENEQESRALGVWRSGLLSLESHDRFSVRLADAFVHRVYTRKRRNDYPLAADAYRGMLQRIGDSSHTISGQRRLVQRLRHLGLVLPKDVRRRAGLPSSDDAITPNMVSSVRGDTLLTWWRREDPLPGTRVNEQIHEHLQRVATALEEYHHENTIYGFDERGEIYVRFGPPDEDVVVNFSESRLTDLIYEREVGVDVNFSDFPANEFWSYGNVDRELYYIFVQKTTGDPYTIGRIEDLLPRTLQAAYGSSRRAQQRSVYALSVLRAIYRKYSPFHPNMARRHDEVANYLQFVRSAGLEQYNTFEQYRPPSVFLNKTISRDKNQDAVASRTRDDRAPRQISATKRQYGKLPLAVRTARFLNDDGTTRTEVYWAPEAGGLYPDEEQREKLQEDGYRSFDDVLVQFIATQEHRDYRDRVVNRENYRLTDVGGEESTIPAQTFSTKQGDTTLYHLSLQWDQYLVDPDQQSVGPKIKVATERRDSLRTLSSDPDVLEMSDPRPVVVPEGKAPLEKNTVPYPFEQVATNTPIALYFEVYHLARDSDNRTEYTVEYTVQGRANRGAIARLFAGGDKQETVVSSTFRGSSRTAEELIRLDVGDWDLETETTANVTVRVTDELSGAEVSRTLQYQLVPTQ